MLSSNSWARSLLRSHLAPFLVLGPLACSHDKPAESPSYEHPVKAVAPAPQPEPPKADESIVVGEVMRKKCGLPETKGESPQFDFDEAQLRPRGMNILDAVAECVTDGAMKGERVSIIGHTDPRGTDEYNRELGMKRANATRDYLAQKGVPLDVMTVSSRGEADATGDSPDAFQLDRRVEIEETPNAM